MEWRLGENQRSVRNSKYDPSPFIGGSLAIPRDLGSLILSLQLLSALAIQLISIATCYCNALTGNCLKLTQCDGKVGWGRWSGRGKNMISRHFFEDLSPFSGDLGYLIMSLQLLQTLPIKLDNIKICQQIALILNCLELMQFYNRVDRNQQCARAQNTFPRHFFEDLSPFPGDLGSLVMPPQSVLTLLIHMINITTYY